MASSPADIALLLRRAEFGGSPARIAQLAALDLPAAVDAVLDTGAAPPESPPALLSDPTQSNWQQFVGLIQWWLDRMATTATPIVEKMTLFWHGHFTTSFEKTNATDWMYQQQALYRANALGNFATLAQRMAVEPAMLDYLDNAWNVKGHPNQNFARELMELFLLGVGNYTEADVVDVARAWSGHNIDWTTRRYTFRPTRHDSGTKTIFGRTANLDGPDVINLILTAPDLQPIMARFICKKLWEFFAHPDPPPGVVQALADVFVQGGLAIKPVLRALFLRPEFYADASRRGHVRSPIEYAVAVLRATGMAAAAAHPEWWLGDMGQQPLCPPDVSGWKANAYWVSTAAASAKAEWAGYLSWTLHSAGTHPFKDSTTLGVDALVQRAFDVFGITEPSPATRAVLARWVTAQRAAKWQSWAEPPGLFTLTMLSPDLQMG